MTPAAVAPIAAETAAYVDIGTNSVRLMVVRFAPDHSWTVLSMQKETVRLGEGEFGEVRLLQPAAMERAATVCARFAELARTHGATRFVTVATAATREARNADEFVRLLHEAAGLQAHVVSGREEARLIYLGLLSRVHVGDRALVVDIGGGSTEVAVGDATGADVVESVSLGAIRLFSEGPQPDAQGRYTGGDYETLKHQVRLTSQHTLRDVGRPEAAAYATSGTAVNLAAVAARTLHGRTPARDERLALKDLRAVAKRLRALTADERRAVPGLAPARADIIVAGAAILETLMEDLGVETITALDECGLREGLLLDDLGRAEQHEVRHGAGVRERSVLQLARSTAFDEAHARHVARLALELFDSAGGAGLHRLGPTERELLEYAALLHDIGTFLSYTRHHQHTYYLDPARRPRGVRPERGRDHGLGRVLPPQVPPRAEVRGVRGAGPRLAQGGPAARRLPEAGRVPRPRARRGHPARASAARGGEPAARDRAERRLEPRGVVAGAAPREPGEGVRLPHRRGRRAGPGRAGGRRMTTPRAYTTEAGA